MSAKGLLPALALLLFAVACGAGPVPTRPASTAPVVPVAPQPAVLQPVAPVPQGACPVIFTGHAAVPPEYLGCSTTDDCTSAEGGGCCGGSVAVNKSHVACMQAQPLPCDVICDQRPAMATRCVAGTCKQVLAK